MKRLTAILAFAVGVTHSVAFAQEVSPSDNPTWLSIISGTVQTSDTGEIALVFDPVAIIFTDRPAREVSLVNTSDIVDLGWGPAGDFISDPPNASLVNMTTGTIGVVELTHGEIGEGIVTFTYAELEGAPPSVGDRITITIDGFLGGLKRLRNQCRVTHMPLCP